MHTSPRSSRRLLRSFGSVLFLTSLAAALHATDMSFSPAFFASGYNSNGIDFGGSTVGGGTTTRTNTIQPGDTIWLETNAGTRIHKVKLKNIHGTAAAPIRIKNTGGQWLINGDSTVSGDKGLILLGCQHVIIEGQAGTGYDYGIKIDTTFYGDAVHNAAATGLVVGDIAATSTTPVIPSFDIEISGVEITNPGFAGIQVKNAGTPSTYVFDGLRIHHNYIHQTWGEGMYIGWTSTGHERMANVDIHDNIIIDAGWDGIQLNYASSNAKIRDNLVDGYGQHSNNYNPNYWQNKGIVVGNSACDVYNNTVVASGTLNGSGLAYDVSRTNKVYNNVFVWSGDSGEPTYNEPAMYIRNSTDLAPPAGTTLTLAHNTIVTPEGGAIDYASGTATVKFVNNLVVAPGSGSTYTANNSSGTLTVAGNYYKSTVSGAGFVNAANGDYHLSSSSTAIDQASSTYGVTVDLDGTARPQGAGYDPGAYEAPAVGTNGILTPIGTGTATGSSFCPASGAFDSQPTWNATTAKPEGDEADGAASTLTSYANRYFYIDLGTDWAKWRITSTWTRYRSYSGGTYTGFPSMWWDSNTDTANSGTTETRINFNVGTVTHIGTQQWVKDKDFGATPVTPQGRYLVVSSGAAPSSRPNEFAFIGYKVP